jgi:hypothetical protein
VRQPYNLLRFLMRGALQQNAFFALWTKSQLRTRIISEKKNLDSETKSHLRKKHVILQNKKRGNLRQGGGDGRRTGPGSVGPGGT